MLGGIRDILRLQSMSTAQPLPKDPCTISASFNLEPEIKQYICCTACCALYPYDPGSGNEGIVAARCSNQPSLKPDICGVPLWKEQMVTGTQTRTVLIKTYVHQGFKSWLGRLLARKGVEDHIDNCDSMRTSHNEPLEDIWPSAVFRDLKDPSGNPFYPGPGTEGCLVFSLSVDSFDPFGNKTASQSVSSTGIWLVLLNLPWFLRHQREYMYLAGVIPGPKKPSIDELNHYIQLIVSELLKLWDPGVHFSRTYKYALGRLIQAMLVPIVCDMLAARQLIGYAGSPKSHYFCVYCDLDVDDINITDRKEWLQKSATDVRRFAQLWRDLSDPVQRQSAFEAFGWCWSPLFDLPYFDPIKFTVTDTMHALHLGLLQTHCRKLFRIDIDHPGGEGFPVELPNSGAGHTKVLNKRCLKLIKTNDFDLLYQLLEFVQ